MGHAADQDHLAAALALAGFLQGSEEPLVPGGCEQENDAAGDEPRATTFNGCKNGLKRHLKALKGLES